RDRCLELLFGREQRDRCLELLFGREQRDRCLDPLFGRERRDRRLEPLFGRKGWQELLYFREPAIEIFEMSRDHVVVHRPHLLGKDGGERTAILASSRQRNDRTAEP